MYIKYSVLLGTVLLLSGCAGVKSSFDCDATTTDSCMTMTQANELARSKAAKNAGKGAAGGLPSLVNLPAAPAVLPAPVSGTRPVATAPSASVVTPATTQPASGSSLISPPAVAGSPVRSTSVAAVASTTVRPAAPVTLSRSCQTARCDSPGSVHPQRSQDRIATVWIAPWVDDNNNFHQPGRLSFVVSPADWVLPSRIN